MRNYYINVNILKPIADSAAPIVNKNKAAIIPFISSKCRLEDINIKLIPNNSNSNETNINILLLDPPPKEWWWLVNDIILNILSTISTIPMFFIPFFTPS